MGSGEKKIRREVHRVLHKFILRDDSGDYPVKDHPEARDMIIEYASPLDGLFESLVTRFSVAIFAWNLSLVPDEKRDELINEFITPLLGDNEEGRDTITEVILALVARRLDLYTNETYLILPHGNGADASVDGVDELEDEFEEDELEDEFVDESEEDELEYESFDDPYYDELDDDDPYLNDSDEEDDDDD